MRVGIIGAGLQGRRRAPVLAEFPNTELVVVSAATLESAKRLADRMRCEAAQGWEPVVERQDLDAVIVCTPPHLHARISIAAMRSGKHVLCEKPLTKMVEEAEELVRVARETGQTLKCGFNHRHHPGFQQIRKWFDAGRIGEPIFVRCRYGIGGRLGYEKEWRANPEIVGGGQLMEQGIHAVDLARWFLGGFSQVTAFVETRFWGVEPLEDNAFALYRTAGGAVASIHSSLTQWKNLFSFELYGRDGYVAVEGLGGGYGTERAIFGRRDFTAPFGEEVVEFRGEDRSWREEWKEFVAAVSERREPLGSGQDGLEALRLVYAAYEAARKRHTIDL
ncbi:MAG: Gfo/Idh/MocA family oxidoreductase [Chloroflexota bacterium]|nr:Gfo/Idh/MocA family oxidoreductase [Chloroflexota bacterium]